MATSSKKKQLEVGEGIENVLGNPFRVLRMGYTALQAASTGGIPGCEPTELRRGLFDSLFTLLQTTQPLVDAFGDELAVMGFPSESFEDRKRARALLLDAEERMMFLGLTGAPALSAGGPGWTSDEQLGAALRDLASLGRSLRAAWLECERQRGRHRIAEGGRNRQRRGGKPPAKYIYMQAASEQTKIPVSTLMDKTKKWPDTDRKRDELTNQWMLSRKALDGLIAARSRIRRARSDQKL